VDGAGSILEPKPAPPEGGERQKCGAGSDLVLEPAPPRRRCPLLPKWQENGGRTGERAAGLGMALFLFIFVRIINTIYMITHDLRLIADAIIDKKGENVVSLDLREMGGAITDFFVVCDGSNTTQVGAIAGNIAEKMKEEGHTLYRSQGEGNNFWIIQDYGNIVVHIFLKEYRDFYRLEDLWADVPRKEYKERKSSAKAKKQQD
jgi:ribosome-associated protein